MITIVGDTSEEKFAYVERVLRQFSRRIHKNTVALIPPIPICFVVDKIPEDGSLFRYLFPANGVVSVIYVFAESVAKDAKPVLHLDAVLFGTPQAYSISATYGQGATVVKRPMEIQAGMRVAVSTSEPNRVSGLWIAFLYEVTMDKVVVQTHLLNDLLAIVEAEENEDEKVS